MARIGLKATLSFVAGAAVSNIKRTATAFSKLQQQAEQVKRATQQVNRGMSDLGRVGLGVVAGTGLAVRSFAAFEGAFAGVRSILATGAKKEFPQLKQKAEELGATTSFTATQAASAMESLARAGLNANQIMKAIPSVLSAAAAEGISLSTAADIASKNMKAFGLTTKDIPQIVDTLAFVSKNTNSSMVGLQEGLKLVGSSAKALKISVFSTTKALGILNDVGLNGSLAGTALNQVLVKMSKATKNGVIPIMSGLSARLEKNADGGVNLEQTMLNVVTALKTIKDPTKRLNAGMKIFAVRGAKGALAFNRLMKDGKLFTKFYGDGTAKGMAKVNAQIKGTAKRMAKIRLDSIAGDFTLFKSALEGVSINFSKAFGGSMRGALQKVTAGLSQASAAFQFFAKNPEAIGKKGIPAIKGVSKEAASFVKGVLLGIDDLKKGFTSVKNTLVGVAKTFGFFSGDGTGMARTATKVLGVSAAIAVLGVGLKVTTTLFGGMARVGLGAAKGLMVAFKPLGSLFVKLGGGIAKKMPLLAKAGGRAGGFLGRMFKGLGSLTAQPVTVMNTAELALATKASNPIGAGVGVFASLRSGLNAAASKLPLFGTALAGSVGGLFSLKGGLLKTAGKLGLAAAGIAAVGFAGYKAGQFLEKKFGVGSKLGLALSGFFNRRKIAAGAAASKKKFIGVSAKAEVTNLLSVLKAGRTKSVRFLGDNRRRLITRELAKERIRNRLAKSGVTGTAADAQIKALKPLLDKLPTKDQVVLSKKELADEIRRGLQDSLKINLQVDGKVIATTVGAIKKESKDRGIVNNNRRAIAAGASQ